MAITQLHVNKPALPPWIQPLYYPTAAYQNQECLCASSPRIRCNLWTHHHFDQLLSLALPRGLLGSQTPRMPAAGHPMWYNHCHLCQNIEMQHTDYLLSQFCWDAVLQQWILHSQWYHCYQCRPVFVKILQKIKRGGEPHKYLVNIREVLPYTRSVV